MTPVGLTIAQCGLLLNSATGTVSHIGLNFSQAVSLVSVSIADSTNTYQWNSTAFLPDGANQNFWVKLVCGPRGTAVTQGRRADPTQVNAGTVSITITATGASQVPVIVQQPVVYIND